MMLQRTSTELLKAAAMVPARTALGSSMIFHGVGKLRAPEPAGQAFHGMGVRPGKPMAIAAGLAEVFAGVGAVLGVWTRPAALAVLVTQAVAIWKVHGSKGFDITKGGFEYNATLMAIAAGLLLAGPGAFSVHEALEHAVQGTGARRLYRKARPGPLLRFIKLLK